jgi:hypothetical protein
MGEGESCIRQSLLTLQPRIRGYFLWYFVAELNRSPECERLVSFPIDERSMALAVGIEPTIFRLTGGCCTPQLHENGRRDWVIYATPELRIVEYRSDRH